MSVEDQSCKNLPLYIQGEVVKGFGRGSTQLGFPTANIDPNAFKSVLSDLDLGVYFGWAKVDGLDTQTERMVMSVGLNLTFDSTEKTCEAYILKEYHETFYGKNIKVIAVGWIREMLKFDSLEALINAIQNDVDIAKKHLKIPPYSDYKLDPFFDEK